MRSSRLSVCAHLDVNVQVTRQRWTLLGFTDNTEVLRYRLVLCVHTQACTHIHIHNHILVERLIYQSTTLQTGACFLLFTCFKIKVNVSNNMSPIPTMGVGCWKKYRYCYIYVSRWQELFKYIFEPHPWKILWLLYSRETQVSGNIMFSSAMQLPPPPPRPPPYHNFVVSAITFEGFKLRSSNLTQLLLQISPKNSIIDIIVPSKIQNGRQKKSLYRSEMTRIAIES